MSVRTKIIELVKGKRPAPLPPAEPSEPVASVPPTEPETTIMADNQPTVPSGTDKAPEASPTITPAVAATPAAPQPATFAELNAEFASDPEFIVQTMRDGMTMPAAYKAYAAKAKAEADNLRKLGEAGKAGTSPIPGGPSKASAASDEYLAEIERVMVTEKKGRPEATAQVNRDRPDLRAKYVGRKAATV